MKLSDIFAMTLITAIVIVFIVTMLALAWAIFEDTELGQTIVEHFKDRWEDDEQR